MTRTLESQPLQTTGQADAGKNRFALFAVALLYVSFGTAFGLLQGGLPPILRERGVDLQALGWTFALYVPLGLTFLWAPLVDRFSILPGLGRRVGWMVAMQAVTIVLLCLVAVGEGYPRAILFAAGLGIAFATATMDLALDAYAVEAFGIRHRPLAAALKVGFLASGGIIGGGIFVGLFDRLGWTTIFFLVAALTLVCTLPCFWLPERGRATGTAEAPKVGLLRALANPLMLRRLAFLASITTVLIAIAFFDRIVLVERGVELESIGWIFGTLSPIANIAATFMATALTRILSERAAIWSLAAVCLLGTLTIVLGMAAGMTTPLIGAMILQSAAAAGLSVKVYTLMLEWSVGHQAATDYAVLCGGSRLVATGALMIIPTAVASSGWPSFYVVCAVLLLGLLGLLQFRPALVGGSPAARRLLQGQRRL